MNATLHSQIETYLQAANIKPFHVANTIVWVDKVMAGNRHFVTEINSPKLRARLGRVVRFEFDAITSIPDANTTQNMHVVYTYKPSSRIAHRVKISPANS